MLVSQVFFVVVSSDENKIECKYRKTNLISKRVQTKNRTSVKTSKEKINFSENLEVSDELLALAAHYRTKIMTELADHYRRTIGEEQGMGRMGLLLCLLQQIRVSQHTKLNISN